MMLENNKWYKSINGSVIFKTGSSSGFGLSSIYGWARMSTINFKLIRLWKEITSPKEVLKAINKGMKFIGYNDDTLIEPFRIVYRVDTLLQSPWNRLKPIKLKGYHFDLKDSECINLLLNHGELWLTKRNSLNYVCILKGGKFSKIVKRYA